MVSKLDFEKQGRGVQTCMQHHKMQRKECSQKDKSIKAINRFV